MTRRISQASLEYVPVEVIGTQGGAVVDPTSDVVQMAFLSPGAVPTSGDWKTANWITDTSGPVPRYFARCLVGPAGTVTLGTGLYQPWVKLTAAPEIPAEPAEGYLEVF